MKRCIAYVGLVLGGALMPALMMAQELKNTRPLLKAAQEAMNTVIGIAILLAFLFFIIGIINFIRKANDPTGRSEGRQQIIWGIVAIVVLSTIWGIVFWIRAELGLNQGNNPGLLQMFGLTAGGGSGGGGDCPGCNPGEDGFGNRLPRP